jgi:hypothetical protein
MGVFREIWLALPQLSTYLRLTGAKTARLENVRVIRDPFGTGLCLLGVTKGLPSLHLTGVLISGRDVMS